MKENFKQLKEELQSGYSLDLVDPHGNYGDDSGDTVLELLILVEQLEHLIDYPCRTCNKPIGKSSPVCSAVHKPWLYKDGVYIGPKETP